MLRAIGMILLIACVTFIALFTVTFTHKVVQDRRVERMSK